MRIILAIILAAIFVLSSYAGTVTLSNNSWVSFRPVPPYGFSCAVYHDASNTISCSSITDSTDFYWMYYEGCTCLCLCCPSIAIASKRPFYVSKHAMDYSDYKGDTAKLADTTLFIKCDTSEYPFGIKCFQPFFFSSVVLVTSGNYGIVPDTNSLYTRLLDFRTRFSNYPPLRYVPLKIDRIVSVTTNCLYASGSSNTYDSIQVTFGNTLTGTAVPAMVAPVSRSALHISKTREGYMISGLGEGRGLLEIVNAQGKTVCCRSVVLSPCVIGKNILGPGIYFIQVHLQTGTSSIVLPVH